MSFNEKLTLLRKRRGLTRIELAELVGVSYRTVATWESGEAMPDIDKLVRLAEALGVSTDTLLSDKLSVNESGEPTEALPDKKTIGTTEIGEYLRAKYKLSLMAAIALLVQVFAVIAFSAFITVSNETDKGFFVFIGLGAFVVIAYTSVFLFVSAFKATKKFAYITRGEFLLSPGTEELIAKAEAENKSTLRIRNAVGVGFLIMAAVVIRVLNLFESELLTAILTLVALLLFGVAITLFVMSGVERSVLYTLKNPADSPAEASKRTEKRARGAIAFIFSVIYLFYSLASGDWQKSWLILVLWLAASAITSMAFSLVRKISDD